MKIYLAAPWKNREMMPELSAIFEAAGHTITMKWWETEVIEAEGRNHNADLRTQAEHDRDGVFNADVVVVFNTAKSEGKAVEQGLAIAKGIPIIAVGKLGGESKNVFHYLKCYTWVDDINGAIKELETRHV